MSLTKDLLSEVCGVGESVGCGLLLGVSVGVGEASTNVGVGEAVSDGVGVGVGVRFSDGVGVEVGVRFSNGVGFGVRDARGFSVFRSPNCLKSKNVTPDAITEPRINAKIIKEVMILALPGLRSDAPPLSLWLMFVNLLLNT
jgi:hypothetical protein